MISQATHVRVSDPLEDRWDDPVHGRVAWRTLISGDKTPSDSLVCGVARFPGHGCLNPHYHAASEVVHVLSGTGIAQINESEHSMQPGDTLFIPGNVVHSFYADQEGLELLYFFGVDRFDEVEYVFDIEEGMQ